MSPSVRAELLRLQCAQGWHDRATGVPGAVRNTPPPPQRRRRCVHARASHSGGTRALQVVFVNETVTYASPSLSKPLLRLTDGMSSMCRFPGSYVLCCGGARAPWVVGGGPPPRPRLAPLLENPLLPRGFDIVCRVSASVVCLPFHPLSLCGPPNFTRGTVPSKLSLLPSRRK